MLFHDKREILFLVNTASSCAADARLILVLLVLVARNGVVDFTVEDVVIQLLDVRSDVLVAQQSCRYRHCAYSANRRRRDILVSETRR